MHKLFASQSENERIYLIVRQHWLVPTGKLLLVLLSGIILTVAWWWLPRLIPEIFVESVRDIFNILYFGALLILLFGALVVFILFYLSLQIITDQRCVDVDQLSLFKRNVSELQIENVEEVTSQAHGILSTFFDYGDVLVQTSGAKIEFTFEKVPHHEQIKKLILDLYESRGTRMNPHHTQTHEPKS